MMKIIELYTQDKCQACRLAETKMKKLNIKFKTIKINSENKDKILKMGYNFTPVTIVYDNKVVNSWEGLNIDKIEELLQ